MKEYIPYEATLYRQHNDRWAFRGFCYEIHALLGKNPQGMTLPSIQRVIGLSAKTTKSALQAVTVERDGKFYLKGVNL